MQTRKKFGLIFFLKRHLYFCRYGRAELKQSDHRPILAIMDVEVHKVDSEKREKVFQEALKELGPPDGSIVLQFDDVIGADLNEIVDEHFTETLKTKITEEFGDLRFILFIRLYAPRVVNILKTPASKRKI